MAFPQVSASKFPHDRPHPTHGRGLLHGNGGGFIFVENQAVEK